MDDPILEPKVWRREVERCLASTAWAEKLDNLEQIKNEDPELHGRIVALRAGS